MLKRFWRHRKSLKAAGMDDARSLMASNIGELADAIGNLIPPGHHVTAAQLDKVETDLSREFITSAREGWAADGMKPEAIELITPIVEREFRSQFHDKIRAAIPLQNLRVEGGA